MRTYGRDKNGTWFRITETSHVWLATLVQTLRLGQGESPFFGNYGIPAQQSVITQIAPDAAVARTQAQYAPYFAMLTVTKDNAARQPTYAVECVFQDGTLVNDKVYT
jgi:hypothetical protein